MAVSDIYLPAANACGERLEREQRERPVRCSAGLDSPAYQWTTSSLLLPQG